VSQRGIGARPRHRLHEHVSWPRWCIREAIDAAADSEPMGTTGQLASSIGGMPSSAASAVVTYPYWSSARSTGAAGKALLAESVRQNRTETVRHAHRRFVGGGPTRPGSPWNLVLSAFGETVFGSVVSNGPSDCTSFGRL
jgi:hypothetical protein